MSSPVPPGASGWVVSFTYTEVVILIAFGIPDFTCVRVFIPFPSSLQGVQPGHPLMGASRHEILFLGHPGQVVVSLTPLLFSILVVLLPGLNGGGGSG